MLTNMLTTMLFNTKQTFFEFQNASNLNTTGLDNLFVYVADVVPIFFPMMFLSLFIIIMAGTYFSQSRLTGRGDFGGSFAVAGFITTGVAFAVNLIDGVVNTETLGVLVSVTIIGIIYLFINKPR